MNTSGGKGSKARPLSVSAQEYGNNYDRIFGKNRTIVKAHVPFENTTTEELKEEFYTFLRNVDPVTVELFNSIYETISLSTLMENLYSIEKIYRALLLKDRITDTLRALHDNGPLYDGDIPSKAERDTLFMIGACAKVVVKGDSGYNACTYEGMYLLRVIDRLNTLTIPEDYTKKIQNIYLIAKELKKRLGDKE